VLRLLASHRNPESYVGGSTPLNRGALRFSADINVFQDRQERVVEAALEDAATLQTAGYTVDWLRQAPTIYTAAVTKDDSGTRLEWVVDSDYRFFPTIRDEMFGYILHPVDLAANKVMAAAGRHELRDLVDLVTIHETILPLGAVVWAAVDKSPGFTPEGLIAEIRRNMHYPALEWLKVDSTEPLNPKYITAQLLSALDEAAAFVAAMPTEKAGLLFLRDGRVMQPDPARLADYQTHGGARHGQWPTSGEIASAMLDRYTKPSGAR
jgi:hypothetical protein